MAAIRSGTFNAWTLAMGGSSADVGGHSGAGIVRVSAVDVVESTPRTLRGATGGHGTPGVSDGSGGGCYVISGQGYRLQTTIDCRSARDDTFGLGRLTTFTVRQPDLSGGTVHAVRKHFQLYPDVPVGASLQL